MLSKIRPLSVFLGKNKFIGCLSSIFFYLISVYFINLYLSISSDFISFKQNFENFRLRRSVTITIQKTYDLSCMFKSISILKFIHIFPRRKWCQSKSTILFFVQMIMVTYVVDFREIVCLFRGCIVFQPVFFFSGKDNTSLNHSNSEGGKKKQPG